MAKIDITKHKSYREDMTAEEKLALYEAYEIPDAPEPFDPSKYISKELYDKKASEAAAYSKKLKEKMTADEQAELERQATQAALEEELKNLRREKEVSAYKAKYLELGYDSTLATATAESMADGDMEKVFANQQSYIDGLKKAVKAQGIADDPKPVAGSGGDAGIDYQKKFQEAQSAGDFAAAAYYARLEQQQAQANQK